MEISVSKINQEYVKEKKSIGNNNGQTVQPATTKHLFSSLMKNQTVHDNE